MKLLVLVFLVSSSISISLISGTPLQYDEKYSFELISIDNLLTKHDPTLTPKERSLISAPPVTKRQEVFAVDGSYFMQLGVGTPPQNVYLSLDTGSDVVWIPCLHCKKSCYNQSDPIFDPIKSSTFSQIPCGSPRCKQLQINSNGCGGKHKKICLYNATYNSGSFSKGTFSTETLTLGPRKTKLKHIALGCGYDNQGWLTKSAGLLGLGRGNLSFITQTKDQLKSQFSYCLAHWYSNPSNSSIVFGPSAVPTDQTAAAYTPLIYTNTTTTYYYVNLTGISVNGTSVPGINSSISDLKTNGDWEDGGVIIDSGTAYTHLIKEAYVALRDAFREAIKNQTNASVSVGPPKKYSWFDTCYNIPRELSGSVEIPIVELHFDKGANMSLGADNTMILMNYTTKVDTLCFAFESDNFYTTIGNFQQQSFQIVYDVQGSRLGIVPEAC